ncbi:MAG: Nif3-like dinuclear metal center hexameric protein [Chitinophagales bacterium]|nr:Nif3-like dinuclear metal center hexameric protein [Chitinophagales bacterium]
MKIGKILNHLENIAPGIYQESYDNSGLIVGDRNTNVESALICLDSTENVIDEAIKQKCKLVIAHHPIVFSGLKSISRSDYIGRVLIKAIKNDIAIYSIHTNLDNVANGVNKMIADKLKLKNCKILAPKLDTLYKITFRTQVEENEKIGGEIDAAIKSEFDHFTIEDFNVVGISQEKTNGRSVSMIKTEICYPKDRHSMVMKKASIINEEFGTTFEISELQTPNVNIGSGMIGELKKEMNETEFLGYLKKQLEVEVIRHTGLLRKKVRKIAICGGSGSFLLNKAIQTGADFFISADFKYHQFFDADGKIVVADIGHFESEKFTRQLLFNYLSEKFPNFAFRLSRINTNPIKYFK